MNRGRRVLIPGPSVSTTGFLHNSLLIVQLVALFIIICPLKVRVSRENQ